MGATAIGPYTFRTKQAATLEIQRILHDTTPGDRLGGYEAELVTALIASHPTAEEKIGVGIDHIEVRTIDYGSPGYWIVRLDGTMDDFSYKKALNGAELSPRAQARAAMRMAIRDQIDQFRRQAFSQSPIIVCPLTQQQMTAADRVHVDHIEEFASIADTFVATLPGGYESVPISSSATHPGPALTEPLLSAWRQYHVERAQLRIVHPAANLARARKAKAPEFTFQDLRPNVRTEPHPLGGQRLFDDTDQCAECGESLDGAGLLTRCAQFHVKGKLVTR